MQVHSTVRSQPGDTNPQGARRGSGHAIVLGAGMSGLLAARVLADRFERVTVLDRDRAVRSDDPVSRAGAPQGDHVHVLLAKGLELMERWFPGLVADLDAAGAPTVDWTGDCKMMGLGGWNPRFASGLTTRTCSRSLLESRLRDRLRARPNISIRGGVAVEGLQLTGSAAEGTGAIAGITVRIGECRETWPADLVVDGTGRASKTPQWLETLGYDRPTEAQVDSRLGYASRWYRMPTEGDRDWKALLLWAKPPHQPRAGVLYPVEGNRWIVTISGIGGDYPPADVAGFDAFLGSLRDRAIYDATRTAKPLGAPKLYRGTANRWRRYDRLHRFPRGLLVTGDAVCAFNPLYGQGMTAAAIGAELLEAALTCQRDRPLNLAQLDRQFRPRLARALQLPWLMATGEDLRWPGTRCIANPVTPVSRAVQWYLERVLRQTDTSPFIHHTVWRIQHMVASPLELLHPRILSRALLGSVPHPKTPLPMDLDRSCPLIPPLPVSPALHPR